MKAGSRKAVRGRYLPIGSVSVIHIRQMYDIYARYYDNVSLDIFTRDMSEKTGILVIQDKADDRIVGFSTLTTLDFEHNGRKVKGVFSGDTIIEREYWGNVALQVQFYLFVVRFKLRHPLTPVFWLLISKGYKTYLLLANNFRCYFPHPEGRYGNLEKYVHAYCRKLFPRYFREDSGLLDFGQGYSHLKGDVTPITDEMRETFPKIGFFEQCNPTWERGTELPCIGYVGFRDIVGFPLKTRRKRKNQRADRGARVSPAAEVRYE